MNRIHGVKYKLEHKGQLVYLVCKSPYANNARIFDMNGNRISSTITERQALCDRVDNEGLQPVQMAVS